MTEPQPQAPQLETLAFWRAQPGALMLMGRAPGPLPKAGSVRTPGGLGRVGMFRAEFWPSADRNEVTYVAAIRLPEHADPAENARLAIRGSRLADRDIPLVLHHACSEAEFGALAADLAGSQAAHVARFLLDVTRPQDGADTRSAQTLLTSFLARAATPDGCVETILAVPQRSVLLQGWGSTDEDEVELLVSAAGLARYAAPVVRFDRSDVPPPASGIVLALPADALGTLAGLETVFILAGNRLLARRIIDNRVLDAESSIGQLRYLLPRLTGARAAMDLVRLAVQPQFQGQDTLIGSGRPVRAALDFAVAVEGAGSYLSGWIFDPAGEVAELSLCWTGNAVRIDQTAVRIARDDVCQAFRNNPQFPIASGHEPGFAVACEAVPTPLPSAHLCLKFNDGELAFVPVRFGGAWSAATRRALLQSIDLHKPSGQAIIERHVAPFLSRLRPAAEPPALPVLLGPVERSHAIIVPLRSALPPRAFIASFLRDKPHDYEQIVFVVSSEWAYDHHRVLIDLVRFYDLPATILALAEDALPANALAAAAAFTDAETFLFLSPDAAGTAPGWRQALYEDAESDEVACPTILYEDQSIRFAGSTNVLFTDRAPYARAIAQGAGMPRQALARGGLPRSMEGGSLGCCLIPRSVVALLGRTAPLTTGFGQEIGFFLSLHDAEVPRRWVASVNVVVPEDDSDGAPLPRVIDGWILKDRWGGGQPCAF